MAIDKKYGRVTLERGDVGGDEPVVVFRARDKLLPGMLGRYWNMCQEAGSPQKHLDLISQRIDELDEWQDAHPDLVRVPASAGYQPPAPE